MASGYKVTEDEFDNIKSKLRWSEPRFVAQRVKRHLAIVLKVQAARSYQEYQDISKAEHPPTKNSLGDRVAELERWRRDEVDPQLEHDQRKLTQQAFDLHGNEHDHSSAI